MSSVPKPDPPFDEHRLEMIRLGREANARVGVPAPGEMNVSSRELRAMQRARGLRPEDNSGSRDLMQMRYGDDWEAE